MNEEHSLFVRSQLAIAMALLFGLVVVSTLQVANVLAQPVTPTRVAGACTGTISTTLSTNALRMCDTGGVTTRIQPDCPFCPGGINVVFASYRNHGSSSRNWTVQELLTALGIVEAMGRSDAKVGVILYSHPGGPRVALPLTNDYKEARGQLAQPKYGGYDGGTPFPQVATEVLKMLREGRRGATQGLEPCEIVVFMAYTVGETEETGGGSWQHLRDAGRMLRSEGVALVTGCPYTPQSGGGGKCAPKLGQF